MLKKIIMKNFKSYMEKAELDLNATGYEILNETNNYRRFSDRYRERLANPGTARFAGAADDLTGG